MAKPPISNLREQIERTKGNVSAVARAYNVERSTVYNWINASPTLQKALDDARETMVDTAESVLYKRVAQDQDMQAVMYVLNNMPQAKRRGWGPRQEITGADGKAIIVSWGDNDGDD